MHGANEYDEEDVIPNPTTPKPSKKKQLSEQEPNSNLTQLQWSHE